MLRGIVIVLFCVCWSCLKGNLLVTVIQLSERTPVPFRFVLGSTAAAAARRISWCHKPKENATAGRRQMSPLVVLRNALNGFDLICVCVSSALQLGQVDVHAHVQKGEEVVLRLCVREQSYAGILHTTGVAILLRCYPTTTNKNNKIKRTCIGITGVVWYDNQCMGLFHSLGTDDIKYGINNIKSNCSTINWQLKANTKWQQHELLVCCVFVFQSRKLNTRFYRWSI